MFSEHPGRRIAVAGAVVLVAALWLMPSEMRQTSGLKLARGFGTVAPAVVLGGLVGWLLYNIHAWFWTTFSLLLVTLIIVLGDPAAGLGWIITAGGIYLCISLAFYVFYVLNLESREMQTEEEPRGREPD